jgi:hypothetical protein
MAQPHNRIVWNADLQDDGRMCRNIRPLHHFEPPTTAEEIEAAALQYVRKVSGTTRPSAADDPAFQAAVVAVAAATRDLLAKLPARGAPKTREREAEKAREKWSRRELQMVKKLSKS